MAPARLECLPVQTLSCTDTTKIPIPDPLTIQKVAKRRAAAGKLNAGAAAAADVEAFKGRTSHLHKPWAKRWDRKSQSRA